MLHVQSGSRERWLLLGTQPWTSLPQPMDGAVHAQCLPISTHLSRMVPWQTCPDVFDTHDKPSEDCPWIFFLGSVATRLHCQG